jgi:hypothetical protein
MASPISTYDPTRVKLMIAGYELGGFGEGSVITAKRASPVFTKKVGSFGRVMRNRSPDKSGTIEVVLQETSRANDYLSGLLAIDEQNLSNSIVSAGPTDVIIQDLNGASIVHGAEAWVQGWPEVGYGREGTDRKWTIEIAEMEILVLGNADPNFPLPAELTTANPGIEDAVNRLGYPT